MIEDNFNISIRMPLKMVGAKSQQEFEQAVARACSQGQLQGSGSLPTNMVLRIPKIDLEIVVDGPIELE